MPSGYDFHVWHKDPVTGVRKWCGQFIDPKNALGWKNKQEHPEQYTVNNIGPLAVARAAQPPSTPKQTEADRLAAKRKAERYAGAVSGASTAVSPARPKKVVTPPRRKTKEEQEMAEQAKGLLEQHKADEKADLDAGINR